MINAEVPTTRTRGPLGAVIAGLLQRDPRARLTGVQAAALLSGEPPTPPTGIRAPRAARPARSPLLAGARPARRRWPALVGVAVLGLVGRARRGAAVAARAAAGPAVFTYGEGGDIPAVPVALHQLPAGPVGRRAAVHHDTSCDDPHDVEIFDSLDLFDYPARRALPRTRGHRGRGGPACALVFGSGKITGPDKAKLRVAALVPSAAAFAYRSSPTSSFSSRSVLCALYAADGTQITGSRIAKPAA